MLLHPPCHPPRYSAHHPTCEHSARVYDVAPGILTNQQCAPLRTFVRIFVLRPDELAAAAQASDGTEFSFGAQNDADMRRYLQTRLALVLRAYSTTVEVWVDGSAPRASDMGGRC